MDCCEVAGTGKAGPIATILFGLMFLQCPSAQATVRQISGKTKELRAVRKFRSWGNKIILNMN